MEPMEVWVLESGEFPGNLGLKGVYASKDLARPDFERIAARMVEDHARFNAEFNPHKKSPIDLAQQSADGSLILRTGCDVVSLYPTQVITQRQVSA